MASARRRGDFAWARRLGGHCAFAESQRRGCGGELALGLRACLAIGAGPIPRKAVAGWPGSLAARAAACRDGLARSEEHTSELQSLMRISYAVFCLQKKTKKVYWLVSGLIFQIDIVDRLVARRHIHKSRKPQTSSET